MPCAEAVGPRLSKADGEVRPKGPFGSDLWEGLGSGLWDTIAFGTRQYWDYSAADPAGCYRLLRSAARCVSGEVSEHGFSSQRVSGEVSEHGLSLLGIKLVQAAGRSAERRVFHLFGIGLCV